MDKAPLKGAAEEWVGAEDREWDLEKGKWAAPGRVPARQENAYARNVVLQPPIKLELPVTRYSVLSVAHLWSENEDHLTK